MNEWQLIIPMSGLGSRFVRAGYTDPKPLITLDGRRLIEWVLRMFPGAEDPLFICRREHIETTPMRSILTALRPKGRIVVIEGAKLGPVDALLKAEDAIPDNRPALVSYCDYYMHWNYAAFRGAMEALGAAGAVPCYTGFHPHLMPEKNLYACCRVDGEDRMLEIREKHSFEKDKTQARHSPGVYYFNSGATLKKYGHQLMAREDSLNGEYYASMIFNHLVADGLPVYAPANVNHFCQWGTPQDVDEYHYWTKIAARLAK